MTLANINWHSLPLHLKAILHENTSPCNIELGSIQQIDSNTIAVEVAGERKILKYDKYIEISRDAIKTYFDNESLDLPVDKELWYRVEPSGGESWEVERITGKTDAIAESLSLFIEENIDRFIPKDFQCLAYEHSICILIKPDRCWVHCRCFESTLYHHTFTVVTQDNLKLSTTDREIDPQENSF